MDELKPCPFCGGKARTSFRQYRFKGQNYYGEKLIRYAFYGICNTCKATGAKIMADIHCGFKAEREEKQYYQELAAEAWNRRADLPEPPKE